MLQYPQRQIPDQSWRASATALKHGKMGSMGVDEEEFDEQDDTLCWKFRAEGVREAKSAKPESAKR